MALITRISRLFRADFHAVLDRLEEPDVLLRQAVREMEEQLAAAEQRIARLRGEASRLAQRRTEAEQALARHNEEIGICFASGNDDLARTVIRRKLETQQALTALDKKRGDTDKALVEQQTLYRENQSLFESMRQKAEFFTEQAQSNSPCHYMHSGGEGAFRVGEEDIEVAFLREKHAFKQTTAGPAKPQGEAQ